ncbi:hypothetical protein NDU88_010454 [Pleurodeles waltl]|uniref:Uncharacterized protein n=1 Tax=Pleurodeles waltl TaxID=8319 RepID=A0AAV7QXK6_PLEWA|nr:hypothetical protein NDU88_010454 [Pleurodeles waltl]
MAPSTVSAWVAPEATQRAALPIGHTWDTQDERAVKGEVPERQEEADTDRKDLAERTREEGNRRTAGVPGERKPV